MSLKKLLAGFRFDREFYVFLIFLRAIAFWMGWAFFKTGMPWSVALMYREGGQDLEYYPFMTMLASSGMKDAADYLIHGTRVVSFPFGSAWIHSIFYNLMGIAGVVVADFLVATTVFFLLSRVFRRFGSSDFIARTLSLFVVIGVTGKLAGFSGVIHDRLGSYDQVIEFVVFLTFLVFAALALLKKKVHPLGLMASGGALLLLLARTQWEYYFWRFPRPFVTEIYFLSFVLLAWKLWDENNLFRNVKIWLGLGVVFSLLLQSELHQTFYCGILLAILVFSRLREGFRFAEFTKSAIAFVVPFSIFSIPFFIQRLNENPDLPGRYGLYSQPRTKLFFWLSSLMDQDVYLFALLGVLFYFAFLYFKNPEGKRRFEAMTVAYFLAFFSVTLFTLITGKVIVAGRFYTILIYFTTLGTLLGAGALATEALKEKQIDLESPLQKKWIHGLVMIIAGINLAMGARKALALQTHTRSDFSEYAALPNYQQNFSELVKVLQSEGISRSESIATFDMQVYHWWASSKRGKAFIPSQYASPLSDREIEERLMAVTRELGLTGEEFVQFVTGRTVNLFFFTNMKYHFAKGYLSSSWEDYSLEDQLSYSGVWEGSTGYAFPLSEKKRLQEKFSHFPIPETSHLPDVIVLHAHPILDGKTPDLNLYEMIYSNEVFKVWHKKGLK